MLVMEAAESQQDENDFGAFEDANFSNPETEPETKEKIDSEDGFGEGEEFGDFNEVQVSNDNDDAQKSIDNVNLLRNNDEKSNEVDESTDPSNFGDFSAFNTVGVEVPETPNSMDDTSKIDKEITADNAKQEIEYPSLSQDTDVFHEVSESNIIPNSTKNALENSPENPSLSNDEDFGDFGEFEDFSKPSEDLPVENSQACKEILESVNGHDDQLDSKNQAVTYELNNGPSSINPNSFINPQVNISSDGFGAFEGEKQGSLSDGCDKEHIKTITGAKVGEENGRSDENILVAVEDFQGVDKVHTSSNHTQIENDGENENSDAINVDTPESEQNSNIFTNDNSKERCEITTLQDTQNNLCGSIQTLEANTSTMLAEEEKPEEDVNFAEHTCIEEYEKEVSSDVSAGSKNESNDAFGDFSAFDSVPTSNNDLLLNPAIDVQSTLNPKINSDHDYPTLHKENLSSEPDEEKKEAGLEKESNSPILMDLPSADVSKTMETSKKSSADMVANSIEIEHHLDDIPDAENDSIKRNNENNLQTKVDECSELNDLNGESSAQEISQDVSEGSNGEDDKLPTTEMKLELHDGESTTGKEKFEDAEIIERSNSSVKAQVCEEENLESKDNPYGHNLLEKGNEVSISPKATSHDDFGDFSDFDSAPLVSSERESAEAKSQEIITKDATLSNVEETHSDDEDFGDFTDFQTDAAAPNSFRDLGDLNENKLDSEASAQDVGGEDEFGDFAEFDGPEISTDIQLETLEKQNSTRDDIDITNVSIHNENISIQHEEEEDDFGTFNVAQHTEEEDNSSESKKNSGEDSSDFGDFKDVQSKKIQSNQMVSDEVEKDVEFSGFGTFSASNQETEETTNSSFVKNATSVFQTTFECLETSKSAKTVEIEEIYDPVSVQSLLQSISSKRDFSNLWSEASLIKYMDRTDLFVSKPPAIIINDHSSLRSDVQQDFQIDLRKPFVSKHVVSASSNTKKSTQKSNEEDTSKSKSQNSMNGTMRKNENETNKNDFKSFDLSKGDQEKSSGLRGSVLSLRKAIKGIRTGKNASSTERKNIKKKPHESPKDAVDSKNTKADLVLSQIPDLSYMLHSHLCLPGKNRNVESDDTNTVESGLSESFSKLSNEGIAFEAFS